MRTAAAAGSAGRLRKLNRLILPGEWRAFMHLPAELAIHSKRYPARELGSPAVGG